MHLVTMAILIICLVTVFPSLWEKTCYFYLSFLSVASQGLWDPSSPTGDWAWALWQWKWRVLPTGPPVKSQAVSFLSDLSKKKKESEVTQSCLTLCDPWTVACRLFHPWNFPGKNTGVGGHFLLRGSCQPRDPTQVSHIAGRLFTNWATRESLPVNHGEAKIWNLSHMVKNLPAKQETWVLSLGWEDSLEKGMATHSSILVWEILWTEEPGELQSVGSQRVRHDWGIYTPLYLKAARE